ncbi:MAG: LamG domain-containing protein, partial [Verrucomicrobia bacterium]|nr:LamG domain-containing protein [Verrucomicrobiota bacterium]
MNETADFLELPANSFQGIEESTVEAWVKFDEITRNQRIFQFGHSQGDLSLTTSWIFQGNGLTFVIADGGLHAIHRPVLKTNEWFHVAGVSGRDGMKLYYNGTLIGEDPYQGSFDVIAEGAQGRLGGTVTDGVWPFRGQMTEIRVWGEARTLEQIRDTMFEPLTGTEPGLVSLWNFSDADQPGRDAGPGAHHGSLVGEAQVVEAQLPVSFDEPVLELPGSDDSFLQLPPRLLDGLQEATIEGWFQQSNRQEGYTKIATFAEAEFPAKRIVLQLSPSKNDPLLLSFDRFATGTTREGAGDGWLGRTVSAQNVAHPGVWVHFALVLRATNMVLHAYGAPVATLEGEGLDSLETTSLIALGHEGFKGRLDDIRLWSVARTPEQIREGMNTNLEGDEPGLLGWWNFEDGTARDGSTNGHHGTLQGSARVIKAPGPDSIAS